ncbi:MAG: PQQ-binding-like beta-propeller repeat protein, partial [Thaumarchaeota archaeon]|nr:PQQ-binding-like beta-propeller repeat protein [Nitrososphaerota archaeon]
MTVNNLRLLSISLIVMLVASSLFLAIPIIPKVFAQRQIPGANWEYANYNSQATNFNPQTEITKANVRLLELKWMYPIPQISAGGGAVNVGEGFFGLKILEGSTTPPIVVDGVIYIATNYYLIIALEASTGKVIWTYQYKADVPEAQKKLPIGGAVGHLHALYYIDGNLVFPGVKCDIIALGTGRLSVVRQISWSIDDYCSDIPGNAGFYGALFSYPPVLYKKENTLIVVPAVVDGMTGRGFVAGYDITTRQLKWRFFTAPPAGGDPDWA